MPKKQQQQLQQTQWQPQRQLEQLLVGSDDNLLAPPAFPQPVSSLLSDQAQQYFTAFPEALTAAIAVPAAVISPALQPTGMLPVSSRAHSCSSPAADLQQRQQPVDGTGLYGVLPNGNGLRYQAVTAAAVPGNSIAPYGPAYDAPIMTYDMPIAPYGFGSSGYAGVDNTGVPLLTEGAAFVTDMVFANRQMRHAFLRKVLSLLTVQLLLTAAVAAPLIMHKSVRHFLHHNPWMFGLAVILTTTVLLVMAWSESARRRHPTNALLLLLFTAAQGMLIGTASATYSTHVLLLGTLIAAVVSLALIAYASQTAVDFTASGGILYSALVVLLVVTLANWFLGFKTLHLLIGGCGALVFGAYLVYDVQLLASGESCYQVSADEYVFAAMNVYTDVITLFMYILQVLTQLQGGEEQ